MGRSSGVYLTLAEDYTCPSGDSCEGEIELYASEMTWIFSGNHQTQ